MKRFEYSMDVLHAIDLAKFLLGRATSWPVLCFITILIFKTQLANLLHRAKSVRVGTGGIKIESDPAQAQIQSESVSASNTVMLPAGNTTASLSAISDAGKATYTSTIAEPVVKERATVIMAQLEALNYDDVGMIEALVESLAVYNLLYSAELIYRLIFGSQIHLLKQLNTGGPLPELKIQLNYIAVRYHHPDVYENYPCEKYMEFLISHSLVVHIEGKYDITNEGKAFLKWMVETGLSEDKPF